MIATLNLNGDYISDALAAQVGGIGIAPGANINYLTGHAVFEATHGTAPRYAGQDKVNPGSLILSGEMMLRHLGWDEAADLVVQVARADHRPEAGDLRLRAADGRRDPAQDFGVRPGHGREHVERTFAPSSPSLSSPEPVDLAPVPLGGPPLLGEKRGVEGLELDRHGLAGGPALRPLLVQPRRVGRRSPPAR